MTNTYSFINYEVFLVNVFQVHMPPKQVGQLFRPINVLLIFYYILLVFSKI